MPNDVIRIIDIDGHVREADDLFEKYLESPYRARAPKVEKVANGQMLFRIEGERHHRRPDETPFPIKDDGSPANENRHLATHPKQRLVAMDRDRIERAHDRRRRTGGREPTRPVARDLAGAARSAIEVFPPMPAMLARRAGMERGHILVQSADRAALQRFLPHWRSALAALPGRRVRWALDVDPLGFA